MEGVLDPLMRQMLTKNKHIDYCTTEFVRVTDKLLPKHVFYRYAPELRDDSRTQSKTPVLVQLLGGKPDWMAENAKRAKDLGAYGIDLNFGCPAKTVNRHDGGATLLKDPSRLFDTISKIKNTLGQDFHVSAKVRLGFDNKNLVTDIAKACFESGADWMTVHARTKEEAYKPPAHWEFIKLMKENTPKDFCIFANGDIWSLEKYKECVEKSLCKDVMIGRGLLRNPFLAEEIKSNKELNYKVKEEKTLTLIREYLTKGAQVYGETKALNRVKQWLRICTYPEHPRFKKIFELAKRARSTLEIKSYIEH